MSAAAANVVTMFEPAAGEDAPARVPVEARPSRGGKWVTLGDEQYRIPPLGFAAIQEMQDDVESLGKMGRRPTPAQMGVIAGIVHAAVRRNYPSMAQETIADMLDLGNYQEVLGAVLAIAGFEKAAVGMGGSAGVDWDAAYCTLIDAFGWSWEYIDEEMTLPRYRAILAHWERTPPLSVSAWVIAQSLGAKKPAPRARAAGSALPDDAERAGNRQALLDLFGGTPGMKLSSEKPAWLTTPT